MKLRVVLLLVVSCGFAGAATLLFEGILGTSADVPAPPVSNLDETPLPVRPAPGGGVAFVQQLFPVLQPGQEPVWPFAFNTGAGALEIMITDLGCLQQQCSTPEGMHFAGNVYEAILDGKSVGFAPVRGLGREGLLPLGFSAFLPSGLLFLHVSAGQHSLNFDDPTLSYYGVALDWPGGGNVPGFGAKIPDFNRSTAFHVTVEFVPEPATGFLTAPGFIILALSGYRSLRAWT